MENKAFLANPKHLDLVSRCGEYYCSDHNKKNGDYYKFPTLSHFMDEH